MCGQPLRRRPALSIGVLGIGIIVWGGRQEAQLDVIAIALVSGLTYVNIHTTNYPAGEIRGQVIPAD